MYTRRINWGHDWRKSRMRLVPAVEKRETYTGLLSAFLTLLVTAVVACLLLLAPSYLEIAERVVTSGVQKAQLQSHLWRTA